ERHGVKKAGSLQIGARRVERGLVPIAPADRRLSGRQFTRACPRTELFPDLSIEILEPFERKPAPEAGRDPPADLGRLQQKGSSAANGVEQRLFRGPSGQ